MKRVTLTLALLATLALPGLAKAARTAEPGAEPERPLANPAPVTPGDEGNDDGKDED